jgi:uncharacterized NAD(P)/FAD-binding protein YdhS
MDENSSTPIHVDLLFVGAGVSTSYTLLAVLDQLGRSELTRVVRIAVVERADDAYGGLPYGARSGDTSLIITSLKDFLPPEERDRFAAWLTTNKSWAFDRFVASGGTLSDKWRDTHRDAIANNHWDDLYLPRTVFGRYIADRVGAAVEAGEQAGWLQHTLVHDTVTALTPGGDGYVVRGSASIIGHARRAVLAIGSTPNQGRLAGPDGHANIATCLIDEPYEPSVASTMDRIHRSLTDAFDSSAHTAPARVLLVGGNASTLEMLYLLNDSGHPGLRNAEFFVLSPRGVLPERLVAANPDANFGPLALEALEPTTCTAEEVYLAAIADVARGSSDGLTISDTLSPISRAVGGIVAKLSHAEQLSFAEVWGVEIGRFQRRAGTEYSDLVESLIGLRRLHLVAGHFASVVTSDGGRATFEYNTADGVQRFPMPMDVMINCSGFSPVDRQRSATLLDQLLADGVCATTRGGRGIAVNDDMEANRDLFVMGPMLAGNVTARGAIWHMEHCGRVSTFGAVLGETIADRIVRDSSVSESMSGVSQTSISESMSGRE